MSHEFRTPLVSILSASEMLGIYGDRLTGMLDNVVLLERADAEMFAFDPKPVDIDSLCRRVADQVLLAERTTRIISIRGGDKIGSPVVDEDLVKHILSNVVSNAVKYSREGDTIDVFPAIEDTELVITVVDQAGRAADRFDREDTGQDGADMPWMPKESSESSYFMTRFRVLAPQ